MLVTMLKLFDNSVIISSISKLFVLRTTFKARNKKKADGKKKKKKKQSPSLSYFCSYILFAWVLIWGRQKVRWVDEIKKFAGVNCRG